MPKISLLTMLSSKGIPAVSVPLCWVIRLKMAALPGITVIVPDWPEIFPSSTRMLHVPARIRVVFSFVVDEPLKKLT